MPSRRQKRHFGPSDLATSGHLAWASCSSAAKSRSGKDAGSARSRRLRARLRTPPERALQRPGECDARVRGPPLNAPPLLLPDAVVRLGRHVLDAEDLEAGGLERPDRGLAARAGAFHEDLDLLESVLHSLARAGVCGDLRGERSRLSRALEPCRPGRLPHDYRPVLVRERDDRVVERRLDMRLTDGDVLLDPATRPAPGRLSARRSHQVLVAVLLPRPTVFFGPFRVRAFVFVRWPFTGRLRRCLSPR